MENFPKIKLVNWSIGFAVRAGCQNWPMFGTPIHVRHFTLAPIFSKTFFSFPPRHLHFELIPTWNEQSFMLSLSSRSFSTFSDIVQTIFSPTGGRFCLVVLLLSVATYGLAGDDICCRNTSRFGLANIFYGHVRRNSYSCKLSVKQIRQPNFGGDTWKRRILTIAKSEVYESTVGPLLTCGPHVLTFKCPFGNLVEEIWRHFQFVVPYSSHSVQRTKDYFLESQCIEALENLEYSTQVTLKC